MRMMVLIAGLLVSAGASAANIPAEMLQYECGQASNGLSCTLVNTGSSWEMRLHLTVDAEMLSEAERARLVYQQNRLIMRFFQAGGRHFEITSDHWETVDRRYCSGWKGSVRSVNCETD